MPTDEQTAAPLSLRQRRRAAAVQEILDAAERHITEHGPAALSLRAIARSLGMTVQALYHYFPSRDDLVTALIAKAYDALTEAVQAAVDAATDDSARERVLVAAEGTANGPSPIPSSSNSSTGRRCATTRLPSRARPPRPCDG